MIIFNSKSSARTFFKIRPIVIAVFVFLVFLALFAKANKFLDPDFGWYITEGKLIHVHGILKTDPFSYTMPSFPFIEHEWLNTALIARAYSFGFGQLMVTVFLSITALGAIFVSLRNSLSRDFISKNKFGIETAALFILGIGTIYPYFGLRFQVESWLFLAILLRLTLDTKLWNVSKWLLPAAFALWVNLHGSFSIGLFTLGTVVFIRQLRLKKFVFEDSLVFILSFFATLLNPYGIRIWQEIFMTTTDSHLKWRILEWEPSFFNSGVFFPTFFPVAVTLLWLNRKKLFLEEKVLFVVFSIMAWSVTRHVPLWVVVALPLVRFSYLNLKDSVKNIKYGLPRMEKFTSFFSILCLVLFLITTFVNLTYTKGLTAGGFYPDKAIIFLRGNPSQGNIFSVYNWGGYLIWKFPEKKVFVDGRMPSWTWNANLPGESNSAMDDYLAVLSGKLDYKVVFQKYDVDTVLWPREELPKSGLNIISRMQSLYSDFTNRQNPFHLTKELKEAGWKVIYEDETSVILRK